MVPYLVVVAAIAVGGPLVPPAIARRAWSTVEPKRFAALFWAAIIGLSMCLAAIGWVGLAISAFGAAAALEGPDPDLTSVAVPGVLVMYWTAGLLHGTVAAWRSATRRRRLADLEPFRLAPLSGRVAAAAAWVALVAVTTTVFVLADIVLFDVGLDFGFRGVINPGERPIDPDVRRGLVALVPAVVVPVLHIALGALQVRALLRDRRGAATPAGRIDVDPVLPADIGTGAR
jgi:hypothetical protein